MQGLHHYQPKLFVQIDLDSLIPQNHILKKIDKILDLSFVRELTSKYYQDLFCLYEFCLIPF